MSYLTQPLTQMFPVFHGVLGHWYPTILDSSPMVVFFFYKKCHFLFSVLPTGEIILSGSKDGLVAVSSSHTGMTLRVLADHKGSPITVLQCIRKQVRPHSLPRCWAGARSPLLYCQNHSIAFVFHSTVILGWKEVSSGWPPAWTGGSASGPPTG